MARCWLAYEDGDRGHEVTYDCELEQGHAGWHVAHVETASEWGTITWDIKPGYRISRGRDGEHVEAAAPHA